MRFKGHLRPEAARPDMIALINCIFLVMMFFMLSSTIISQPGVHVELPRVAPAKLVPGGPELHVTLTAGGGIFVGHGASTWPGLRVRLRSLQKQRPDHVVVIKADRNVPHEAITRVMAYAHRAGFQKVSLAVGRPDLRRPLRGS